jgi:hypothetical protein
MAASHLAPAPMTRSRARRAIPPGVPYWASATLAGVLLGVGATLALLTQEGMGHGIASGPWHTSLSIGSIKDKPNTPPARRNPTSFRCG